MVMNPPANDVAVLMRRANTELGRFQGPEQFDAVGVSLAAPSTYQSRPLNLNRPLESITLVLRGRVAVSVASYAAVGVESFANLIQMIQLSGQHVRYGSLVPIRMTGATAFAWPRLFQSSGSDLLVNGTRVADPGRPYVPAFLGTTAGSPYDFQLMINIPMAPMMGISPTIKRQSTAFLAMPESWQNTLQLQIDLGDASALGDPTGATVAFTAFGSGAGTPTLEVHLNYAILGSFRSKMDTGVVLRTEQTLNDFVAVANATRLTNLQKRPTTSVVLKTGTIETTGQTAGVTTYETLSDVQLNRTQIIVDNKPVRNNTNNLVAKDYYGRMFSTVQPEGYLLLSFVDGQSAELAYRGNGLSAGSQFDLISDVIAASADNRQSVIQEMIIGGPTGGA